MKTNDLDSDEPCEFCRFELVCDIICKNHCGPPSFEGYKPKTMRQKNNEEIARQING
jgi:hypothetical protein